MGAQQQFAHATFLQGMLNTAPKAGGLTINLARGLLSERWTLLAAL